MKRKILLYYMILFMVGSLIAGFVFSGAAQRIYKQEVEENLSNTARLLHYQLSHDISEGKIVDYNLLAGAYAERLTHSYPERESTPIHARVTFVDYDGTVLGESGTDYSEMENHQDRKEVQGAITVGFGKEIRFSKTLKMNFLYVAVPLKASRIVIRVSVPLIKLEKINRMIWGYSLMGVIAGIIITGFLALKFSSLVLSPVNQLIAVSNEIAEGSYSKRVHVKATGELSVLSQTFNRMASALEKKVSDLQEQNIKINTIIDSMSEGIVAVDREYRILLINTVARELFEIEKTAVVIGKNLLSFTRNNSIYDLLNETIRKNTSGTDEIDSGPPEDKILSIHTNPIRQKNATGNAGGILILQDITNIKKLENIRTEFVSNVTHELKTPLTSIRGFVETLRNGAINDGEVAQKFLEIIDIEADRLYALINDILQLSEIESLEEEKNPGLCNLKTAVDEVLPILKQMAENKKIKITAKVPGDIEIAANAARIKQMLMNLIDNGIKYNVENGSIAIQAFQVEGKTVIKVSDTGIGISKEHHARVFERFYRVDKGRSRSMGGTGLGLSIVKHIVNLYHGDIKVRSKPNHGTEFTIQLPL